MFEVHQQKGEIVENIDAGQRVGEFEAIEQCRLAVERQMLRRCRSPWQRRTLPAARRASSNARRRHSTPRAIFRGSTRPALRRNRPPRRRPGADGWSRRFRSSATAAALVGALLGRVMEWRRCDRRARPSSRGSSLPALRQRVKQQRLVEAAHRDDPVDLRLLVAEAHTAPAGSRPSRRSFEIERGRRPPVQRQLGRTGLAAATRAVEKSR